MNIITFYDRKIRLWTSFYVDVKGNQIGNAYYGVSKKLSINGLSK